jgi:putative peptidoglycan lipid II flippase
MADTARASPPGPLHVRRIASAASVVGAATLLSRILGFLRDMSIAWLLGAGLQADVFFAAFRIPSTLRELLGEGALSAAFVPTLTRTATREGREAAWELVAAVMGTLAVVLGVVSALGVLLAPAVVYLLAPGFAAIPGKLPLTGELVRLMFPYVFLVGLAALFMGALNSLGHFLTPALSPIVLNLVLIGAVLLVAPRAENPLLPLGLAVLVGGAGQLLVQVPAALRLGWKGRLALRPRDPRVRQIAHLMAPGVVGLAITQINVFVGTLLASLLPQGAVATMTYAFRLVQFPIGVIGVAIATAALPVLAAAAARDALEEMKGALGASLRLAAFLTLPAMVGLAAFRLPIVQVLFERGAFTRPVSEWTAEILLAYVAGLVFYVSNRILAPAFYALHDTWTPMLTGAGAVALNICASLLLMGPLGAAGLALGTALASGGNFVLLTLRLRRRLGPLGGRQIVAAVARVGLACLPMAAWCVGVQRWWDVLTLSGTGGKLLLLLAEMAGATLVFLVAAILLGCQEVGWTRDLLLRSGGKGDRQSGAAC